MNIGTESISSMMSIYQASGQTGKPEGVGGPGGMRRPEGVGGSGGGGRPAGVEQMWQQRQAAASSPGSEANVSPMAQMFSSLSSMSDTDKSEIQGFRNQMMDAIKSGEFDAAAMAEQAPDSIKALAEENGIDLTALLEQMPDKAAQRQAQAGGTMQYQATSLLSDSMQADNSISSLLDALSDD